MSKKRSKWWDNLPTERRAEITRYYEHKRDKPKRKKLNLPDLTQEEITQINQNMVDIGFERFIVLREEGDILY